MRVNNNYITKENSILFFGVNPKTNENVTSSLSNYINSIDVLESVPRYVNLANYDLIIVDLEYFSIKDLSHIVKNDFYNTPIIFLTNDLDSIEFEDIQNISVKNILLKEEQFINKLFVYAYIILQKSDKIVLKDGFMYSLKDDRFYHKNKEVALTKLELKLFKYLIKNINRVVNYEEIKKNVWENKPCSIYSLRNVINKIREKSYYDIINNVSKHGYTINNDYTYF